MMQHEVTLFALKHPDISISILLGFEDGDLLLSGYDCGARVEASRGDWDYEYSIRVQRDVLPALYTHFGVAQSDGLGLVTAIRREFHGNYSYSNFMKFLTEQGFPYEAVSW